MHKVVQTWASGLILCKQSSSAINMDPTVNCGVIQVIDRKVKQSLILAELLGPDECVALRC